MRSKPRRSSTEDASHRAHQLHMRLTPAQEAVVVELRRLLLLPLDDLVAVTQEFISPAVSRPRLHCCLRRHDVSNLQALKPPPINSGTRPVEPFKDYEPGFVHVDVKYLPRMPDEDSTQYLFTAIDRATRWVYVEILPEKNAQNAAGFLERLIAKAPFRITRVLTDNGKAFTDRCCATVQIYNQHIPQKALGHIAPIQTLKDWRDKRPEHFKKRFYNLWGLDTCSNKSRVQIYARFAHNQHIQDDVQSTKLLLYALCNQKR